MRNVFGRRPAASSLPDDASQSWDAATGALVVHLPVRTERPEDHESTDRLTAAIVSTVDAINAGDIDHDVIPADAVSPTVRIVLEPSHRDLGPLELRTVEIFAERLGVAIPLTYVPGANPPGEDDEADDVASVELPEPDDDGTSVEVPPVAFGWDDERAALTADLDVPVTSSDGASRRALSAVMDRVFAALRDAPARDLVPEGVPATYLVTVSFAPGAVVGPTTVALADQIDAQLEGTALTVEVVAD